MLRPVPPFPTGPGRPYSTRGGAEETLVGWVGVGPRPPLRLSTVPVTFPPLPLASMLPLPFPLLWGITWRSKNPRYGSGCPGCHRLQSSNLHDSWYLQTWFGNHPRISLCFCSSAFSAEGLGALPPPVAPPTAPTPTVPTHGPGPVFCHCAPQVQGFSPAFP